jgi:hypothetical protein
VLGLDHHAHAARAQVQVQVVGHLLGEAFLHLGAAGAARSAAGRSRTPGPARIRSAVTVIATPPVIFTSER